MKQCIFAKCTERNSAYFVITKNEQHVLHICRVCRTEGLARGREQVWNLNILVNLKPKWNLSRAVPQPSEVCLMGNARTKLLYLEWSDACLFTDIFSWFDKTGDPRRVRLSTRGERRRSRRLPTGNLDRFLQCLLLYGLAPENHIPLHVDLIMK